MSRIKELREKNARIHDNAKAILEGIKDDAKPEERAEAERQFDEAMAEFDRNQAEIDRLERLVRAGQTRQADQEAEQRRLEEERRGRRPGGDGTAGGRASEDEKPTVRAAFTDMLRYGFDGVSQEMRSVLQENGIYRPMSALEPEERALASGTGSAGGFTIPKEFLPELEKTMAIWGPMLNPSAIRVMTTDSGNTIEWPSIDDTAQRGDQFAENAEITDDGGVDPVFGQLTLGAYMHASEIVKIPIQLLTDSAFNFETDLMPELFGERMARTANDKLTLGTGSSQPQGIVVGAGAGLTAASATAIAADELIDLQHKVNPAYRASPKAGFMFNDVVLNRLRKLKDGENRYIWQAPDIRTGEPATLLDAPYWINPSMADPAANAIPIVYGDLSKYITRIVRGFTMFPFRERYMNHLQVGFMSFGRIDGRVTNTAAIKKLTMAAS